MLAFFTSRRGFSEVGEVASRNEGLLLPLQVMFLFLKRNEQINIHICIYIHMCVDLI